jgi:hypothetical protein
VSSLAATVVIPTHDHSLTLRASVASVLRQTVSDIEVFVVGDDVPSQTRDIMREFVNADARVQFFDYPKGPRNGEIYRHQLLGSARGRIVCYLSDDDLYLSHHVETMAAMLDRADFANALAAEARIDGSLLPFSVDLTHALFRRDLRKGRNRIPLSAGAHTLEAYRKLALGWSTTPKGTPTDLFMWQKFLRHSGCRFESGSQLSVLVFPSAARPGWTAAERCQELRGWMDRIEGLQNPGGWRQGSSFQVFFPSPKGHNEHDSVRFWVRFGVWQTVVLTIPYCRSDKPIRIDPANAPCRIQLADITVRGLDGTIPWRLSDANIHRLKFRGTAGWSWQEDVITILNQGLDPCVVLPRLQKSWVGDQVRLEFRVKLEARSSM